MPTPATTVAVARDDGAVFGLVVVRANSGMELESREQDESVDECFQCRSRVRHRAAGERKARGAHAYSVSTL